MIAVAALGVGPSACGSGDGDDESAKNGAARPTTGAKKQEASTPAIGVPVRAGDYELTLKRARVKNTLTSSGIPGEDPETIRPPGQLVFVVVEVSLRNLNRKPGIAISSNKFAAVDSRGQGYEPEVGRGVVGWSVGQLNLQNRRKDEISFGLGFAVPEAQSRRQFKLTFEGAPDIPFTP